MGAVNLIWLDSKETCGIHASGRPPSSLRAAVVGRSGRRTRDGLLILQRHEWGPRLVNVQSRLAHLLPWTSHSEIRDRLAA